MISDKRVLDFTKKMILIGDIAVFLIILVFIYLSFFAGGSNSIQVYNVDEDSKRNVSVVELDSEELRKGKEVLLGKNRGVWVQSGEKYYTFELSEIFTDSQKASIYIEDLPLNVVFEKDQERKFDLNSDGYYDVSVYLKRVSSMEAVFLFKEANEKVQAGDSFVFWFDYLKGNASKDVERQNYLVLIFYIMIAILLVFVLFSVIPILKKYSRLRRIKGRKSYSEVMKYLVEQFNENKRYNQRKALRIYERMKFIYSNLSSKDKKKYESTINKIEKKVSKWENI